MTNSQIRSRALKMLFRSPKTYWPYVALLYAAIYGVEYLFGLLPFSVTLVGMSLGYLLELLLLPVSIGFCCLAYRLWRGDYDGKLLPGGWFGALIVSLPTWLLDLPTTLAGILKEFWAVGADWLFVVGILLYVFGFLAILVDLRLSLIPHLFARDPKSCLILLCRESWKRMEGKCWRMFAITIPATILLGAVTLLLSFVVGQLSSGWVLVYEVLVFLAVCCFYLPYIYLVRAGLADEIIEGRAEENADEESEKLSPEFEKQTSENS